VAGIRFPSNVEVLLRVFWKLFEKESQKRVDILASCDCVTDRVTAVGVANIDWLVEEDH
jgi:hypothetical protein